MLTLHFFGTPCKILLHNANAAFFLGHPVGPLCLSYTTCNEMTKNTPSDTGLKHIQQNNNTTFHTILPSYQQCQNPSRLVQIKIIICRCDNYPGSVGFPSQRRNETSNFVGGNLQIWRECPEKQKKCSLRIEILLKDRFARKKHF